MEKLNRLIRSIKRNRTAILQAITLGATKLWRELTAAISTPTKPKPPEGPPKWRFGLKANDEEAETLQKDLKPEQPKVKPRPSRISDYDDTQLQALVVISISNARQRFRVKEGAETRVFKSIKRCIERHVDADNDTLIDLLKSEIYMELDGPVV